MAVDGVIPALLRKQRKQKEKEEEERLKAEESKRRNRLDPDDLRVGDNRLPKPVGGNNSQLAPYPIRGVPHRPSLGLENNEAEQGQSASMTLNLGAELLEVDKECLLERLVLEQVMASIFTRCLSFFVLFICLLTVMWLSFPASSFHPVHQSIVRGYDLAGSFAEVSTVEDIQAYMKSAAAMSHAFSPGSSDYVDDVQSKSFIQSPETFPPVMLLGHNQFPALTESFTITVWVKTKVRLDSIIRKTANGLTCWSFGPEAVIFGTHDSHLSEKVVHPWAADIYRPDASQTDAWKISTIRKHVSDNAWHNLGFRVTSTSIDFVYDGAVEPAQSLLRRPVTDCPGGIVTIGSTRFVAEISDLVFFNRYLQNEELMETYVAGRPIDVMLSGSGPRASTNELTVQQQLAEMSTGLKDHFREIKDNVQIGNRNTVRELLLKQTDGKRIVDANSTSDAKSEDSRSSTPGPIMESLDGQEDNTAGSEIMYEFSSSECSTEPFCTERIVNDALSISLRMLPLFKEAIDVSRAFLDQKGEEASKLKELSIFRSMASLLAGFLKRCTHNTTNEFASSNTLQSIMHNDTERFHRAVQQCPKTNYPKELKEAARTWQTLNVPGDFEREVSKVLLADLQKTVLHAEKQNCQLHKKYREKCAFLCGLSCASSQNESSRKPVDDCADEDVRDPWGEYCPWYQENDENCERYSSDTTKENCPKTCNVCAMKQKEVAKRLKELDANDDLLSVEDLNRLLLGANRDDMLMSKNMAPSYVAYYCCLEMEFRTNPASSEWKAILKPDGETSCQYLIDYSTVDKGLLKKVREAFTRDYPRCFGKSSSFNLKSIGFPMEWFKSDAQNVVANILLKDAVFGKLQEKPRAVFSRGSNGETRTIRSNVQRFIRDSPMGDPFSLVVEQPEWEWKACTEDAHCSTVAFACRPDHYNEGDCQTMVSVGYPPQKQFCSSTCWTGLCRHQSVGSGKKVCQPCDASSENELQCGKFVEENSGRNISIKYDKYLKESLSRVNFGEPHEVNIGTFSISVWVKDFSFQRLFDKRVNVTLPAGFADFEGYNSTTSILSCYWLTYSEFCYRTHWYDRKMTCHANPLSYMLRDGKWHHIAVVKRAAESTGKDESGDEAINLKKRNDTLVFFVDGKEGASISLNPYALSDCGGPMVSTVETTHAHDDVTVGQDTTRVKEQLRKIAGVELSHVLPLGGNLSTIMRFSGLGVPKGAVIKRAYLELSAVQNPVRSKIEKLKCPQDTTRKQRSAARETAVSLAIRSLDVEKLFPACTADPTSNYCDMVNWEHFSSCDEHIDKEINATAFKEWKLSIDEWRKTSLRVPIAKENNGKHIHGLYESAPYNAATESESVRISPNVSELVQQIVNRDTYDDEKTEATFLFESGYPCERLASSIGDFFERYIDGGVDNNCGSLYTFSNDIDDYFQFFALSHEGARHADGGSAPRLRIHWCHTKDCLSPTFAGAGDDVKWGSKGFSLSQNSELVVDHRSGYSDVPFEPPVFNDIPYMVFGASTTDDQDPVMEGQMFDFRTMPKAMTLGDVQELYYANLRSVPNWPGPGPLISNRSDKSNLDVAEYMKEVVSIAPPVMLQTRNVRDSCTDLVPALGKSMTDYFDSQVRKKCGDNGPYSCNFPGDADAKNGFFCVDRNKYVTSGVFFARAPVSLGGGTHFFPEFLEMMNLDTVYREKKMLATKNWVDLQSSTVMLVSVFLAPSERIGTVMQLTFENLGAGKVEPSYSLSSFKQMSDNEQKMWIFLCTLIWVICVLDMCFIFASWLFRVQDRKKWRYLALAYRKKRTENIRGNQANLSTEEQDVAERAESHRLKRRMTLITKNSPIFNFWDIFDLGLRAFIFVFVAVYVVTYFSPDLSSNDSKAQIGKMEIFMKYILGLHWYHADKTYKEKVQSFNDQIRLLVAKVEYLLYLRLFGAVLILICLFRIIVYLRVHPRVAILYKTVAASVDDLFHFGITFSFLYAVLAFTATWTFGAMDERYATFSDSCYAQFNMIIGEFPMDPVAELQSFYVAYLFVFCVMMFLTVMNFFLAIIIDSYAAIKEQVDECAVAQNFFVDLYHSNIFHWYRWKLNWPGRWQLIDSLLRADLDGNNVNDQEQSFTVPVRPHDLVAQDIFPDLDSATGFVDHYLTITPHLAGAKRASGAAKNNSVLEHRAALKRLLQLDLVSHDLRGLHREVHPLGRRSEETKELVKHLVRTGQKLLNALRIDKTLFAPDHLAQDGDEGVNGTMVGSTNMKVIGDSIFLGSTQTLNAAYGTRATPDVRPTIEPSHIV